MATSPMEKRPSPKYCCSPGGGYISSGVVVEGAVGENYVPMMGINSKLLGSKKGKKGQKKTQDSCIFASTILQLQNTFLGCKCLTLIPSRMYMLPKRLRVGT